MSLIHENKDGFLSGIAPYWEDFFGRDIMARAGRGGASSVPAVNIEEEKESFKVTLAAPGFQRGDFTIEIDNGVLTVSSKKEEHEEHEERGKYTRREFRYHTFKRSFTLPKAVDVEKIEARYTDGILSIRLPKKEEEKKQAIRQIPII
jgi:HSP20 family protein